MPETQSVNEITRNDDLPAPVATLFAHLDPIALGIAFGVVAGGWLLLGTLALLIKGGMNVGMHLWLLTQYLPGYRVSVGGAFVGFLWGGVFGFLLGFAIARLRNSLTLWYLRVVGRQAEKESLEDLLDRVS